jgi:hypothetical protein
MGAYLSDQLTIQGGVIGVQATYKADITDGMAAHWHVMGGTKDGELSEFGNPQGAGFGAMIVGAGVEIQGDDFKAGYNYTDFGAGPNGEVQEVHYLYAAAYRDVGDVRLAAIGEVKHTFSENQVSGLRSEDTHYVGMVQATGKLSGDFGWRAAGGLADDVPAVEGYLTYKPDNWAVQVGAAVVADKTGNEVVGNLVLKRSF